jgi:LuxR family transcriptional regulator, maltose regulon positive regulatory protein
MAKGGSVGGQVVAQDVPAGRGARFALGKFRLPPLPATLVRRPGLHDRLMAGAGQRLTVVVGSAGAGKSVLLSSWAATRAPHVTSWLSCDEADANPVRFWTGFIEAPQAAEPGFGADAADLLTMDGAVSPDVTASIANDAAKLPAGTAIVVDDFHYAAPAVSGTMTDLVERWPGGAAQLVLASRIDPALRLHRLRMAGELCELRDRDLHFSLAESRDFLANFGVEIAADDAALLHQRSEGWAAALQMAALSLRSAKDPARAGRALDVRSHEIAEYFTAEVLDQQPPELAGFMLDTSVLGELTADACAAVTGRQDAAALLRSVDRASLFLVPLDENRTIFRYHHLVRQLLHAELRARDRTREQALQLRAAEWFESMSDTRHAARHFLAARQTDRALALLQDRVVSDYLHDPALPAPLDLSAMPASLLAAAPDRLLGLATDLLLSGDIARGGEYLDLLERAEPSPLPDSPLAARFAATRTLRYALAGDASQTVTEALTARAIQEQTQVSDDWIASIPMMLLRAYTWLEDPEGVDREAAAALASPELSGPVKLIQVPGAQALAWLESGHLTQAADAAGTAAQQARRLGFDQHFFVVDHLRALAGLALERRDLDTAEQLTEQALSVSEHGRPPFEFLALLDRAAIWAGRGQVRDALATVEAARPVLAPGGGSVLLTRADELEALLRLSLGDLRTPAELASRLPATRRRLLLARIALASGDHQTAQEHLQALPRTDLTPRRALVRQILLAATAVERRDPLTPSILAGAVDAARRGGFLSTVVTTAPQVTSYLAGHPDQLRQDPFTQQLVGAALEVRAAQPDGSRPGSGLPEPLTAAELRVLKLLPTSTYPQMAASLYVSRNTVKTHLRSVYQKLGVASRSEAIERAVDLRLL